MDNIIFYLPETMLKPTETSEKVKVFEKKCKNLKCMEKIAKISSFLEKNAEIS